jgi:hypothetical protein
MDEDLELLIRVSPTCVQTGILFHSLCVMQRWVCSYPSAEFLPAYDSSVQVGMNDAMAYRLFEKYLLE